MMNEIFPFSNALLGGILIGLSAFILLFTIGRIAGISGITANLLSRTDKNATNDDKSWRVVFVIGLVIGAALYQFLIGNELPFREPPSTSLLIIAGLLVGFGTHLGSGCTSGHGVCGIGRFSKRSIIATILFMFFAGVTVFVTRHLIS